MHVVMDSFTDIYFADFGINECSCYAALVRYIMDDRSVLHVGIKRFIGFYIECIRGCCIHTHACGTHYQITEVRITGVGLKEARFIHTSTS